MPRNIDKNFSSVPVTLPSRVPAPSWDPFWTVGTDLVERARLLRSRLAIEKVVLFSTLVNERTMMGDLDLPSLFEAAFNDRSGAAFWKLRLGEMIGPGQFVVLLATYLTAEGGTRSTHELALRATLAGDLSDAGVIPTATEVEHRSVMTHIEPETGNQHLFETAPSFSLEGRKFDPVPVVRWMAEREVYHRLLPTSLRAFCGIESSVQLRPQDGKAKLPIEQTLRRRGPKPDTSQRIEREMLEAIRRGVDLGSMKTEEMRVNFKAAASTCSVARNRVLSELDPKKNFE